MKKKLPLIAIILIFLIGVGVLSYPLVSSVVNNIRRAELSSCLLGGKQHRHASGG